MNWYTKLANRNYWIAAQESNNYPVGHLLRTQIFESEESAARHADGNLHYTSPQKGLPVVYPVKASELTQSFSYLGNRELKGVAQIIGPAKLTERALRLSDKNSYIRLVGISGYAAGFHAYGDEPDVPAGNPGENATWEYEIPFSTVQQIEPIIKGNDVVIQMDDGGSFHERWLTVRAFIAVTHKQELAINEIAPDINSGRLDDDRRLKVVSRSPYTTLQEVITKIMDISGAAAPEEMPEAPVSKMELTQPDATKPKPNQTPEEYYGKLIEIERTKNPKPLQGD